MNNWNDFFHLFLAESFQLDLDELLPHIQYAALFMKLKSEFSQPLIDEGAMDNISYPILGLQQPIWMFRKGFIACGGH